MASAARLTVVALAAATCGFVLAACTTQANPDQGLYACTTDADCGAGYECHAHFTGPSRCHKAGTCAAAETCDGKDDSCDGRVDESFPGMGDACDTGAKGVCAAGAKACFDAGVVCVQKVQSSAELCDGLDNDCNGAVDETFDLTSDPLHCGRCDRACGTGSVCAASACHETACADGTDDDGDGLADCDDPDCAGHVCAAGVSPEPRCGALLELDAGADGGACAPASCGSVGARCGAVADGCGGELFCPCGPVDGGVDGGACTPITCTQASSAGYCGLVGDGCGGLLVCACDGGVTVDAGVRVDAGFPDAGAWDAGLHPSDAGTWLGCLLPESACGDGRDDDGDGLVDCADPDCGAQPCATGKTCVSVSCQ